MQIYITRHTKVAVDKSVCYGQHNVPLADTFLEEAAAIKTKLPTQFDAIFSSPLERCKALAAELTTQHIIFDDRLKEYHFGDWENICWNDINQTELNAWMQDYVNINATNGENLQLFFNRVASFINELRTAEFENVLLVAHSGIIRCMFAYILEIPLKNIFKIPIGFGEIYAFNIGENKRLDGVTSFNI